MVSFRSTRTARPIAVSVDVTETVGIRYQVGDWLALQASHLGLFQSYAYWDGIRDINSGLIFNAVQFGVVARSEIWRSHPTKRDASRFRRRVLSEEGDAFEVGPTVSMAVSYQL